MFPDGAKKQDVAGQAIHECATNTQMPPVEQGSFIRETFAEGFGLFSI